jgi:hypothetical protein
VPRTATAARGDNVGAVRSRQENFSAGDTSSPSTTLLVTACSFHHAVLEGEKGVGIAPDVAGGRSVGDGLVNDREEQREVEFAGYRGVDNERGGGPADGEDVEAERGALLAGQVVRSAVV